MQVAAHRIMSYLYRPSALFHVGLNILAFPTLVFRLHRLRAGWQGWYRRWLAALYRAGGWLLMRQWAAAFRRDGFAERLASAKWEMEITRPGTDTV
jgi:hypothetical protein